MTPVRTRIIAAAAVVAGLAAGATGVALADNTTTATVSPTPSASPSAGAPKGDGARPKLPKGLRPGGRHGPGMLGGGMLGGGGALHGEFVVPDGNGGFRTMVIQRGEVTAVSKTSITVVSEDKFSTTYAVTADTLVNAARDGITTIKKGAKVNVAATKVGGKATAVHIGDQSARKAMKERFGLDGPPATGV
jgi:hypothetical protein